MSNNFFKNYNIFPNIKFSNKYFLFLCITLVYACGFAEDILDTSVVSMPNTEDISVVQKSCTPESKSDYNSIEYQFDGVKIKEYAFKVSYSRKNVPTYEFIKNNKKWTLVDESKNEHYYDGSKDGNKAQIFRISPANIYRYDGFNPLTGTTDEQTSRFLFYAMLDSKAIIAELNNYLIAVDTYSKFVFAYGKITKTKRIAGQDLPLEFEPVENHGERRKFYEYDPIGCTKMEDGKLLINLYDEYKTEMQLNAAEFFPCIHDTSRGTATFESPGLSPYYK